MRAIANCSLPTVSGVGHEIDVTLSDLAADLASADAKRCSAPRGTRCRSHHRIASVARLAAATFDGPDAQVLSRSTQSTQSASCAASTPRVLLPLSRELDDLDRRAALAMESGVGATTHAIRKLRIADDSAQPLRILSRGYNVTIRQSDQQVVKSTTQLQPGERLKTYLTDGNLRKRSTKRYNRASRK